VRPAAQRGHGPAHLDGRALRATVAGKSDELGERRIAADGSGGALKPTPRGERPCVPAARLAGWPLADQVQPVRRHCRGPNEVQRGWADAADTLEGKRSAQAYEGGGVSDESPQGARRRRRLDAMHDSAARLCREAHKVLVNDAVMWETWLTECTAGQLGEKDDDRH
jgi:hypothetical protein